MVSDGLVVVRHGPTFRIGGSRLSIAVGLRSGRPSLCHDVLPSQVCKPVNFHFGTQHGSTGTGNTGNTGTRLASDGGLCDVEVLTECVADDL